MTSSGDRREKALAILEDVLEDIEAMAGEARGGTRDELEAAMEKIDNKATAARYILGVARED